MAKFLHVSLPLAVVGRRIVPVKHGSTYKANGEKQRLRQLRKRGIMTARQQRKAQAWVRRVAQGGGVSP